VLSEALIAANTTFTEQVEVMDRAVDATQAGWKGDAATAASVRAVSERVAANHVGTAVVAVAEHYANYGSVLSQIKTALLGVVDSEARPAGMSVDDDGTVTPPTFPGVAEGVAIAVVMQIELNQKAAWYQSRIKEQLANAGTMDTQAAIAIQNGLDQLTQLKHAPDGGALSGPVQAIVDGRAQLPTDPKQLHDLWANLSPAEKDALYAHDQFLGNKDGVPQIDRDHYNRQTLDTLRTQAASAQGSVDGMAAKHPDWAQGKNIPGSPPANASHHWKDVYADYTMWQRRYDAAKEQSMYLDGYDQVSRQLDSGDGPPRLLSIIDDKGHAGIAINNPDTADNVATFVPGTGATMSQMDRAMARAAAMQQAALLADNSKQSSVIAWYGYDAPQNPITQSPSASFADNAATPLDSFQDGLRVTHDGAPSNNTVIGHSYGTTVIGHAASDGHTLNVDNVVLIASPGVGVGNVGDLSLTGVEPSHNGSHVYATTNTYDPIRLTPTFIHDIQPMNRTSSVPPTSADRGTSRVVLH